MEKKWDAFVAKYSSDDDLFAHKKDVKFLAREGIPPKHRPRLWFVFSGGYQKREAARGTNRGYFQLIQECKTANSSHAEQIEKDLHRTGLKGFAATPELMEKLRRVLSAYAIRNEEVGYCQAMNFIAGLLLLQMPETNAFWTLASIIEDIMPRNYYDDSMKALHVDIRVFGDLVKEKLAKMNQLMLSLEIVLHPITTIWFLGLFVHTMPDEAVCRVWDSLFLEGSKMLFRVGLGLMKLKQREFLECRSFERGYQCLMEPPTEVDAACEVMRIAFDKRWVGKFSMRTIISLRDLHTRTVEEEFALIDEERETARIKREQQMALKEAAKLAAAQAAAAEAAEAQPAEVATSTIESATTGDSEPKAPDISNGAGEEQGDSAPIVASGEKDAAIEVSSGGSGDNGGSAAAIDEFNDDAVPAMVPEKYSKVFSHLGHSAFNASRRNSYALMVGYTGATIANQRRGGITAEQSGLAAAAVAMAAK